MDICLAGNHTTSPYARYLYGSVYLAYEKRNIRLGLTVQFTWLNIRMK